MNDLAKLTVTQDSFLFSISQAYEGRIRNDGNFNSHLKYEPFLDKTWKLPENPDANSLKKTLGEIVEHHFTKLPNYRREESVNIENISWFSHSFAALFADIEYLLLAYTGSGFPILSAAKIPRTNSSKNIILAINKYSSFKGLDANGEKFALFPLVGEENTNLDELYTQEIWSLVFYYIKKYFGVYTELMSLYATWKYTSKVDSSDVVDWNVRPPCGDLYRKQFKHLFEKDYFKKNSNKNGFQKPPHESAPSNANGNAQFGGSRQNSTNSSAEQKPLFKKPNNKFTDRAPRDEKFKFDSNREQRNKEQEEIIAKALLEASQAVQKMQKDESIPEINLAPQNSFIRRQQHVVISDGGFETESRGEGESRCVCIKRK